MASAVSSMAVIALRAGQSMKNVVWSFVV